MNLIAIASQKRMGKGCLAESIKSILELEYRIKEVAFADGVKDCLCELLNVDRNFIEEWKENPEPPPGFLMNVRQMMQFIGDNFRSIKPTVWIDQTERTIKSQSWWKTIHVVSDARYLNEMGRIKEMGGIITLLFRPGYLNDINHPSEKQLLPILKWFIDNEIPEGPCKFDKNENVPGLELIDLYIINDGSLGDLKRKVEQHIVPRLK